MISTKKKSELGDNGLDSLETGGDNFLVHSYPFFAVLVQWCQRDPSVNAAQVFWFGLVGFVQGLFNCVSHSFERFWRPEFFIILLLWIQWADTWTPCCWGTEMLECQIMSVTADLQLGWDSKHNWLQAALASAGWILLPWWKSFCVILVFCPIALWTRKIHDMWELKKKIPLSKKVHVHRATKARQMRLLWFIVDLWCEVFSFSNCTDLWAGHSGASQQCVWIKAGWLVRSFTTQ